jgi:hypothetical protein
MLKVGRREKREPAQARSTLEGSVDPSDASMRDLILNTKRSIRWKRSRLLVYDFFFDTEWQGSDKPFV